MKKRTFFLLAMLCPFLWLGAQTAQIKLDVCHNYFTYVADGPTDANGYSLRGANFHLQGYVYPDGTFDTHGEDSGILANGDPEFPNEVIGTWYCSGWYLMDEAATTTGAWVYSTQLFKVNHPMYGEMQLTSEGTELYDFNVPFYRAVVGATGALKNYKGQMLQENLAGNASGFANVGFVLEMEDAVQTRLTDGSLSFICPDEIQVEAPPNSGGMEVHWEMPAAVSECLDRGIGCGARAIDGFTYLCEWDGNHYYLSNEAMPWEDAKGTCAAMGGRLATVESEEENRFLAQTINMNEGVFIGLSDAQVEGNFQWTDGMTSNYTNWDAGEPNNLGGAENYVAINGWSGGKWADHNFWVAKRFLMEFNCELSPTQIAGPTSGDFLTTGTHVATYEVMDDCGNIAQCEVRIKVDETLDGCGSTAMNVALNKPATQSGGQQGSAAAMANDGNTDGNYWSNNSVAITDWQDNAWWEVDLGDVYKLSEVKIYNRTDCCTDLLKDYYVLISEAPFASHNLDATLMQSGVRSFYKNEIAGSPSEIATGGLGRYVRIQKKGNGMLGLAEVMVTGCPNLSPLITPPVNETFNADAQEDVSFALYPNPTQGELNLQFDQLFDEAVFINIYDLQGRVVQEEIVEKLGNSTIQLQVKNQPSGIYFVTVRVEGKELITRRFLLQQNN